MRSVLLILGLIGASGSFFVPPPDMDKCALSESLGIVICMAPMTSLFEGNPTNYTRARGIRIAQECRNATTCISRFPCASKIRLDKMFGVLCDAFSYLSTDFAPCQKKIEAQKPPCIRKAEKLIVDSEIIKNPCDVINANKACVKTEITDICGESYWLDINKLFKKMERYTNLKCDKQVAHIDDVDKKENENVNENDF